MSAPERTTADDRAICRCGHPAAEHPYDGMLCTHRTGGDRCPCPGFVAYDAGLVTEPPRRAPLRQGDIIRMLLERGSSEHSSVTLGRNSKGDTTIEVIVRTGDTGGVETIEDAEAAAQAVYERLRALYPFGASSATGEGGNGA